MCQMDWSDLVRSDPGELTTQMGQFGPFKTGPLILESSLIHVGQ